MHFLNQNCRSFAMKLRQFWYGKAAVIISNQLEFPLTGIELGRVMKYLGYTRKAKGGNVIWSWLMIT